MGSGPELLRGFLVGGCQCTQAPATNALEISGCADPHMHQARRGSYGCGGTNSSWDFFLEGDQGLNITCTTFPGLTVKRPPIPTPTPIVDPKLAEHGQWACGGDGSVDFCPWFPHPSNEANKAPAYSSDRIKVGLGHTRTSWALMPRAPVVSNSPPDLGLA